MNKNFKEPNFNGKHIEIRRDGDDVEVIATKIGLEKLINFCRDLINNPHQGHIHLEDYDVLTNESLKGALVLRGTGTHFED